MKARLNAILKSADAVALLITLAASLPLIFRNAVVHDFPMGYAGLFTQMAVQIADANFALPASSPFYGPGGIPFAYPPLGLYLLAIFVKTTGSYYIFLRWLPPFLSLFSVLLTFFLAKQLFLFPTTSHFASGNASGKEQVRPRNDGIHPFAAMAIAILTAMSLDLHTAHVWSAGIVRAPAFVFTILFMYFYPAGIGQRSLKSVIFAGMFLGLAFLSHLAYGLFCIFWFISASFFTRELMRSIRDAIIAGLVTALVVCLWVVPVVLTHGWDVFLGALNSHGGSQFISGSFHLVDLFRLLYFNLSPVLSNPLFAIFALVGLFYLLWHRQFRFVFFFFLITLFFPENARFVSWLGCFAAGYGLWFFSGQLSDWAGKYINIPRYVWVALTLCILWWNGYQSLARFSPFLTESALDFQAKRAEIFQEDGAYLALLAQDEAEWLPFLLAREPLVSQWGSEWLGMYEEQTRLMSLFQGCRREKDWECVKTVVAGMDKAPRFVITNRIEKKLNEQILADPLWEEVYANGRYIVWAESEPR